MCRYWNNPNVVEILQIRSRDMWKEMVQLQTITSSIGDTTTSRKKRQFDTKNIRSELELNTPTRGSCCTCQVGSPGVPGPPGRDGRPGLVERLLCFFDLKLGFLLFFEGGRRV